MDRNILLGPLFALACLFVVMDARANEIEQRNAIAADVRALVESRDFAALDALAVRYRNPAERTGSGVWKLESYYTGLADAITSRRPSDAFRKKQAAFVDDWITARPNSASARLAAAILLENHAWNIRGRGYARTVREQDWAPFRDYIERARMYLEQHKSIADVDPHWYASMQRIANSQGWPAERFQQLFEEGTGKYPGYYALYFTATVYLLPKWNGSAQSIDDFARRAMRGTAAEEGAGMYTRIYWVAIDSQFRDGFPENSKVDWALMKKGIDDVIAKYPDDWNIQNFAYFSCLAGDKTKAAALLARMGEQPDMEVWDSMERFTQCHSWATRTRLKSAAQ